MKKIAFILAIAIGSAYAAEPASQPSVPITKSAISEDQALLNKIVERNKKPSSQPAESAMDIKTIINFVMQQIDNLKNTEKNKTDVQIEESFYKLISSMGEKYDYKKIYFNLNITNVAYSNNSNDGNNAHIIMFNFPVDNIIGTKDNKNKFLKVNQGIKAYLDYEDAKNINKNTKISVTGKVRILSEEDFTAFRFICNNASFSRHVYIEVCDIVFTINGKEIETNFTIKKKEETE